MKCAYSQSSRMLHLIDHFERGWHFDPLLSQNAEDLPDKSPLAEGTLKRTHNLNACFSGCLPMEVLPCNATAPEVTEWWSGGSYYLFNPRGSIYVGTIPSLCVSRLSATLFPLSKPLPLAAKFSFSQKGI